MKATVLAAGRLSGFILLVPTPALGQSELPRPTGQYGIGRTVLHWTDPARPETESGTTDSRRELLVYLFYPSDPETQDGGPVSFSRWFGAVRLPVSR